MALGEDWKQKRKREIEEEEAEVKKKLDSGEVRGGLPVEKLVELIDRADTLINQLNNLYSMYISGAEKTPPIERRKTLDQMMVTITYTGKPTQALLFQCNNLVSRYTVHKERWDKMVKNLESGKLKKRMGG